METQNYFGTKTIFTFQDLVDSWLGEKSAIIRPSSMALYRNYACSRLLPAFGDLLLSDIEENEIRRRCSEKLSLRLDGKGELSAKSRIDLLRMLDNILKFGKEQGYIKKDIRIIYPRTKVQKSNILREQELVAFEKILQLEIRNREALGIYLCLYTGIRIGELCGLKWSDINVDTGIIHICRTIQRVSLTGDGKKTTVIAGPPKSVHSERDIPIPEQFLDLFKELKPAQCETYFLSDSLQCFEPRRMQRAFQGYLQMANLEPRGFHCTRHTFATRWVELGIDIKSLSDILGHSSIRITMDKYVHISEKTKRENINKIRPLFL